MNFPLEKDLIKEMRVTGKIISISKGETIIKAGSRMDNIPILNNLDQSETPSKGLLWEGFVQIKPLDSPIFWWQSVVSEPPPGVQVYY